MDKYYFFKPKMCDVLSMQELVVNEVANGNILDRDENEMATTLRSYICIKDVKTNYIIGFVALHIHTTELSEMRSLIVHKNYRGLGIAKSLITRAIDEAKDLMLKRILVLTYKKELFESFSFNEIPKESIPETKIWADCIKCKHFPICDEVALMLDI